MTYHSSSRLITNLTVFVAVYNFAQFVHMVLDGLHCEALGVGMSVTEIFSAITPSGATPLLQVSCPRPSPLHWPLKF